MTGETAPGRRQRSLRVLLATLLLSFVLHAALFAAWPGLVRDHAMLQVRVLDVVLLKPEPLPVAAPEPARAPKQANRTAADRKKLEPPRPRRDNAPGPAVREPARSPLIAPAEPFAAAQSAFGPPPAEGRPASPEQKAEATAAVSPPRHADGRGLGAGADRI